MKRHCKDACTQNSSANRPQVGRDRGVQTGNHLLNTNYWSSYFCVITAPMATA